MFYIQWEEVPSITWYRFDGAIKNGGLLLILELHL